MKGKKELKKEIENTFFYLCIEVIFITVTQIDRKQKATFTFF